ncbi:MAG: sigma 54-interacting transcriptional regulator, partial [Chloroflexota bacterium]
MLRVLVVEKEGRTRALLQCQLRTDIKVKSTPCIEAAMEKLANHKFDLILWNTRSEQHTSVNLNETLFTLSQKTLGIKTIVLTDAQADLTPGVCAGNVCIKQHPSNDEDFLALVESHLPIQYDDKPDLGANGDFDLPFEYEGMIVVGLPMRAVIRRIMEAAAVDIPVLITGETGTGKDLIAAAI